MAEAFVARGTAPGSLRHFAVLYAPRDARPALEALYAFEAEVRNTVETVAHEVAHTRLQWWRMEVDRLLAGQPNHPVTRALLPLRERLGIDVLYALHESLVAADIDLARLAFATDAEFEAYCYRACGALQVIAAQACAGEAGIHAREQDFARRLGSVVRRTELLRDLRGVVAKGRLPIPLDLLHKAGLDPHSLRADTEDARLGTLLESMRARLLETARALPDALEPLQRARQVHGLVLGALHGRLLQRVRHGAGLAAARAEVPPWSRLWTAWRTAVHSA